MSKSQIRKRLNSLEDCVPTSDTSDGTPSELYTDWNEKSQNQQIPTNLTQYHDVNENYDQHSLNQNVTDDERDQLENFFAGIGTEIFVSSSMANLYEKQIPTTSQTSSQSTKNEELDKNWNLIYTGIPIIIFDKGSARSRSTPQIKFCLAERGTCFALWRDTIDNLSQYRVAGPSFHTMHLSTNHSQTIGFSFDCNIAAHQLWQHIEKLISDPENIAINIPGSTMSKKKKNQHKKIKPLPLPPKTQISHPCQFHHVTNVNANDWDRFYSMQAYVRKSKNICL